MRWADVTAFLAYGLAGLLAAVFVPGVGRSVNGSYRWIGTSALGIQPSQAATVVVPLLAAKLFSGKYLNQYDRHYFRTFLLFALLFTGLVAVEPDFGTAFVIAGSALVILLAVELRSATGLVVRQFWDCSPWWQSVSRVRGRCV